MARTRSSPTRRLWSTDRLHLSTAGHRRVAAHVLTALGVEVEPGWWRTPAPPPRSWWLARKGADLAWAGRHLAPWVVRRLTGRSSGDRIIAKRPTLEPLVEGVRLPEPPRPVAQRRWGYANRVTVEAQVPKTSRRDQILEIAVRLFAERGYHGVSMDDIGAAAGVTGPALYHHFAGKEAMLAAALTPVSEGLLAGGRERVAAHAATPGRALDALVDFHVEFALAQPGRDRAAPARAGPAAGGTAAGDPPAAAALRRGVGR